MTWKLRRFITVGSLLVLLGLVGIISMPASTVAYDPPTSLAAAKPGDLLRWEPMPDLNGHPVWRILYLSVDLDDQPAPVSGLIAFPNHPPPVQTFWPGSRIAWQGNPPR